MTVTGQQLRTISWRGRASDLTVPEGWDNLTCEAVQVTSQVCRFRYADRQGVLHYTIYTESSASMPQGVPSSHQNQLHQ
jgi:hypothetical protein